MPKIPNFAKFFSVYLRDPSVPEEFVGEHRMDCPLCGKEEHFYANGSNGMWNCKRCDEGGNARALITQLHLIHLATTTETQYKFLEKMRGISWKVFQQAQFAYDADHDVWYVPYFTYDPEADAFTDYLNNLGYFYPSSTKSPYVIHKAPTLPTYLYNPGLHTTPHTSGVATILEGEWDTLAYYDANPDSEDLILGKPGAGFPKSFLKTLAKCETINSLLDNDVSGLKQTAKVVLTVREHKPKATLNVLDWTLVQDAPKDIRDMKLEKRDNMLEEIEQAMVPYNEDISVPDTDDDQMELTAGYVRDANIFEPVTSFQEFMKLQRTVFQISETTELAQAAVFAITISNDIPGEPLWAFLISPPSSGKTVFIESFGGTNQWFDNLSKLTSEAFVSGWKDDTGKEASYLPNLYKKTLFVKDFTTTLMGPDEAQRKIFGLLTDIYDGHVKIPFGNNQVKEFHNTYFNMIAGVTDIVHAHSAASIGERFLRIDWMGKNYDSREIARRALMNFGHSNEHKKMFTEWTLGFVKHLRSLHIDMHIDEAYIDPIIDLAEFIAVVRTKVETDRFEGMKFKPRSELPARLAKQLGKLFVASKVVMGNSADAFKVVRKVALDTCHGFSMDIINHILQFPATTRDELARDTGIHAQRCYRVLTDLVTTGVLTAYSVSDGRSNGRPRLQYRIANKLLPAMEPEKYLNNEDRSIDRRFRPASTTNSVRPGQSRPPRRSGPTPRKAT